MRNSFAINNRTNERFDFRSFVAFVIQLNVIECHRHLNRIVVETKKNQSNSHRHRVRNTTELESETGRAEQRKNAEITIPHEISHFAAHFVWVWFVVRGGIHWLKLEFEMLICYRK